MTLDLRVPNWIYTLLLLSSYILHAQNYKVLALEAFIVNVISNIVLGLMLMFILSHDSFLKIWLTSLVILFHMIYRMYTYMIGSNLDEVYLRFILPLLVMSIVLALVVHYI